MTSSDTVTPAEVVEAARALLARHSSSARVRAAIDLPDGHEAALWTAMAEAGWHGLVLAPEHGGAGAEAAAFAELLRELGRHLVPTPFMSTIVLAAGAVSLAGDDDQRRRLLPDLAAGRLKGTLALTGDGSAMPARIGITARARRARFILDGVARFVPDAHVADVLVVAARHADGRPSLFAFEPGPLVGLEVDVRPTLDETRRLCDVRLSDVEVPGSALLGRERGAASTITRLVDDMARALACDSLGVAERALAMTVAHVKSREQFGVPIGSFQAVKHRCADMLIAVESARAAVDGAIAAAGSEDASVMASVAKSVACDAAVSVAGAGTQLHGGIGYTWEHDMHLCFKRAQLDAAMFGDSAWHRDRIARGLLAADNG